MSPPRLCSIERSLDHPHSLACRASVLWSLLHLGTPALRTAFQGVLHNEPRDLATQSCSYLVRRPEMNSGINSRLDNFVYTFAERAPLSGNAGLGDHDRHARIVVE